MPSAGQAWWPGVHALPSRCSGGVRWSRGPQGHRPLLTAVQPGDPHSLFARHSISEALYMQWPSTGDMPPTEPYFISGRCRTGHGDGRRLPQRLDLPLPGMARKATRQAHQCVTGFSGSARTRLRSFPASATSSNSPMTALHQVPAEQLGQVRRNTNTGSAAETEGGVRGNRSDTPRRCSLSHARCLGSRFQRSARRHAVGLLM